MQPRGMLWPTIATISGVALLLALGTWQLQRLQWKQGLMTRIAERVHAAPIAIEAVLDEASHGADAEYSHVQARGRFRHDLERFVYAPGQGDWGWDVITPLELAGGRALLVNRGYVPRQLKAQSDRAAGLLAGEVTVIGLLRQSPASRPWYIPAGNRADHTWSWFEVSEIAESMYGTGGKAIATLYLDADATDNRTPPAGGATRLELPNRHLEYAVTWYGLAAALAGLYGFAWVRHFRLRGG